MKHCSHRERERANSLWLKVLYLLKNPWGFQTPSTSCWRRAPAISSEPTIQTWYYMCLILILPPVWEKLSKYLVRGWRNTSSVLADYVWKLDIRVDWEHVTIMDYIASLHVWLTLETYQKRVSSFEQWQMHATSWAEQRMKNWWGSLKSCGCLARFLICGSVGTIIPFHMCGLSHFVNGLLLFHCMCCPHPSFTFLSMQSGFPLMWRVYRHTLAVHI